MFDLTPDSSELNQNLNTVLESYLSKFYREKCYIGLRFSQGKRTMIQINVPAHDLPILLQTKHSENNDPDSGKNRPEVQGHATEVKQYILKRVKQNKPWILGTLTANIDPDRIQLMDLARGLCLVVIPRGVKLDITDGQHRKRAIHELVESPDGELIGDNDFPITLVLEKDFNQCQMDFRDMAQSRALDKSLLLSFGEFEGRIGIMKTVQEQVQIFRDKTEKIKNSPSTKHKLIYTSNYIAKMVSCAFANDLNAELEDWDVEKSSAALINCLNQFFSECKQTQHIFETEASDLTIEQVDNFKEDCLLGRYVGLEVLGRLLYSIYDRDNNNFDSIKVSQLSQLDWSRSGHLWSSNIVTIDPNSKNPAKPYRISVSMSTVKIAVDKVKLHLGWIQPPPTQYQLYS
ncbi:DNA sulfur modification protein DndB [Crocosphaera sp. XPORK-15E]|uniref:DNA sulfur modification protein DndB n=1 Tax=Crocosphaera sp. XPORK-15E TaxID=3110247 RepID=UPI002B204C25|nr:DNA sulfur modification protein DndB [Crocosphaera sp. XPORK-15E]MEA5532446.1 DNA sulfur modification protein DndB [Crocosphaera sp. XPORK-15E]